MNDTSIKDDLITLFMFFAMMSGFASMVFCQAVDSHIGEFNDLCDKYVILKFVAMYGILFIYTLGGVMVCLLIPHGWESDRVTLILRIFIMVTCLSAAIFMIYSPFTCTWCIWDCWIYDII